MWNDEITKKYTGTKIPNGHKLRVDDRQDKGEVIIWYMNSHDDNHIGIARIRSDGQSFEIGWLRGTEQDPYTYTKATGIKDLYAKIDAEIAKRKPE